PALRFALSLELRSLRSAGVSQLHRYYEPLRHPARPSLSLAGVSLTVTRRHRRGFPCFRWVPCPRAVASTPAESWVPIARASCRQGEKTCSPRRRPSPISRRVGFRIRLFEACSAFTHVTARVLAE